MKAQVLLIVLTAIPLFCGCQSDKKATEPQTLSNVSVRTSYSPAATFPEGSKYAFVTMASDSDQNPEVAKVYRRIQTSLSKELKTKGYQAGEYADIRFFVVYTLGLQQQMDILIGKSKIQGNEWISALVVPNDYVSGALLVQIIDAKSMGPVWLGVFNADVALVSVGEPQKQERVEYAVHELLKQFPPK
jgi:hypothetical protein